jgi:hypothetical protein
MSARPTSWHIGEILEAPDLEMLKASVHSGAVVKVIVFDGNAGGRMTLLLTVTAFEEHTTERGRTWPVAHIQYESAASASSKQAELYPRQFVAEQVHNYLGEFDHGTLNAL